MTESRIPYPFRGKTTNILSKEHKHERNARFLE
jgi:hypothetical protein